jgi:hypothetical protein
VVETNPNAAPAAALQPEDYAAPGAAAAAAAPTAPAPPAPAADPYAAQIARWKGRHRSVTEITVRLADDQVVRGFIHNPDRNVIAQALTMVINKKILEAGEFLLMNCWLGGDECMNPNNEDCDDAVVVAASKEAAGTIELLSANSKKL